MLPLLAWTVATLVTLALVHLTRQRALERGRWAEARRLLLAGIRRGRPLTPAELAGLPAPARRYLERALPEGVALATEVEVELEQRVRTDKARGDSPFHLYPLLLVLAAGRGMVGAGRRMGALPRSVLFSYVGGEGRGREALFDLLPALSTAGENVSRTLRNRALFELFFLPSSLLPQAGAVWEAVDERRARVTVTLDGEAMTLTLRVAPDGRLLEVTGPRWGAPGAGTQGCAPIPFGMVVDEEGSFDGYTIPTRLRGGWWYGTDRYVESIRLRVSGACFAEAAPSPLWELRPALSAL